MIHADAEAYELGLAPAPTIRVISPEDFEEGQGR